jgi:XTP/dITP diphosphohydrolase
MPPNSAPVPPKPLLIATGNEGKLREFKALLAALPFQLHSLAELDIPAPYESGRTFAANALLKARHAAAAGAVAALADDSGLEVDALDGAPGVLSARYAGPGADDAANNAKLLAALRGVSPERRSARYRCVLAFVRDADDAAPLLAEATWQGRILDAPQGVNGFGYDPYFWLPDRQVTAAQLEPEQKNLLSHRGRAMRAMLQLLRSRA